MVKQKFINKSAAGLRRSAVAERFLLHAEWSSLKGTEETEPAEKAKKTVFSKNTQNIKERRENVPLKITFQKDKENTQPKSQIEALLGVVALVDVGSENRALALRAALTALGATVVPAWSPVVTHLVWAQGGCRSTRARARGLGCSVVSPLWVEACAASARRISEKVFPSSARASDLPSPAAMCRLLKRAEKENWQLSELLLNNNDSGEERPARLRLSSDSDGTRDKTNDGDSTHDSIDIESRVNTAPRKALPMSISPAPINPKSKRKLFTAKPDGADEESDPETSPRKQSRPKKPPTRPEKAPVRPERSPKRPEKSPQRPEKAPVRPDKSPKPTRVPERKKKNYNLTQEQKKNLERAERLAKRLVKGSAKDRRVNQSPSQLRRISKIPHIVLTGMGKVEHQVVLSAIQSLDCKVQRHVNKRTTHVLLGSCKEVNRIITTATIHEDTQTRQRRQKNKILVCRKCNSDRDILIWVLGHDNVEVGDHCSGGTVPDKDVTVICKRNVTTNRAIDKFTVVSDETDGNGVVSEKNVVDRNADDEITVISDENDVVTDRNLDKRCNVSSDKTASKVVADSNFDKQHSVRSDKVAVNVDKSDKNAISDAPADVIETDDNVDNDNHNISDLCGSIVNDRRLRTLKTLLGAVRGCRVLHARWAMDSQRENQWLPHIGYEVTYLLKIAQKARLERSALGKMHSEYAYDIFRGLPVSVSDTADQRDAAIKLLILCGATITDHRQHAQDGGHTQDGHENEFGEIVRVGKDKDEVSSKWVFDSVVAGRPRTTRRYFNRNIPS